MNNNVRNLIEIRVVHYVTVAKIETTRFSPLMYEIRIKLLLDVAEPVSKYLTLLREEENCPELESSSQYSGTSNQNA